MSKMHKIKIVILYMLYKLNKTLKIFVLNILLNFFARIGCRAVVPGTYLTTAFRIV